MPCLAINDQLIKSRTESCARATLYEHRRVTLIVAVVAATVYLEYRAELETYLEEATRPEPGNLITAIRRILDGERDEDALDKLLDLDGSIIIHTILAGIENPDTLRELLAEQPDYARWFRLQWRKKERADRANPAP
jgi:hypothetical protein